jgi:hypothetical protein
MTDISPALRAYLNSWYDTTAENKRKQDVVVELTFDQFVGLFEKRQLASLQKSIDTNRLRYMQDDKNAFAYVATWKSYSARSTNVWSVETALICSRSKSSTVNLPQPGDKLRPLHRERISNSLTGRTLSDDHRSNISQGCKGVSKTPWPEDRRARASVKASAREAAKRDRA